MKVQNENSKKQNFLRRVTIRAKKNVLLNLNANGLAVSFGITFLSPANGSVDGMCSPDEILKVKRLHALGWLDFEIER